jgi:hypothetical protein
MGSGNLAKAEFANRFQSRGYEGVECAPEDLAGLGRLLIHQVIEFFLQPTGVIVRPLQIISQLP